jgi:hypothetical protein
MALEPPSPPTSGGSDRFDLALTPVGAGLDIGQDTLDHRPGHSPS